MHCLESVKTPLDKMHITSKQRFRANLPPGFFDIKRPGRYPLMFGQYITEFYHRQLSFSADALNAMEGIFRSFREQPDKRRVYNIAGMPIYPARTQGHAVKTPMHSFLSSLFWHHTEVGRRRAELPSWSWAGWEHGSIAATPFYSDLGSNLHITATAMIEDPSGHMIPFPDYAALPDCSIFTPDIRFVHIEAVTLQCTIRYMTDSELPAWKGNLAAGFYARFVDGNETEIYARFHPSARIDPSKQYLGIILPFAKPTDAFYYYFRVSVLVVEQRRGYYERVGIFHVIGHYEILSVTDQITAESAFRVDANGSRMLEQEMDKMWARRSPRERRWVRLG